MESPIQEYRLAESAGTPDLVKALRGQSKMITPITAMSVLQQRAKLARGYRDQTGDSNVTVAEELLAMLGKDNPGPDATNFDIPQIGMPRGYVTPGVQPPMTAQKNISPNVQPSAVKSNWGSAIPPKMMATGGLVSLDPYDIYNRPGFSGRRYAAILGDAGADPLGQGLSTERGYSGPAFDEMDGEHAQVPLPGGEAINDPLGSTPASTGATPFSRGVADALNAISSGSNSDAVRLQMFNEGFAETMRGYSMFDVLTEEEYAEGQNKADWLRANRDRFLSGELNMQGFLHDPDGYMNAHPRPNPNEVSVDISQPYTAPTGATPHVPPNPYSPPRTPEEAVAAAGGGGAPGIPGLDMSRPDMGSYMNDMMALWQQSNPDLLPQDYWDKRQGLYQEQMDRADQRLHYDRGAALVGLGSGLLGTGNFWNKLGTALPEYANTMTGIQRGYDDTTAALETGQLDQEFNEAMYYSTRNSNAFGAAAELAPAMADLDYKYNVEAPIDMFNAGTGRIDALARKSYYENASASGIDMGDLLKAQQDVLTMFEVDAEGYPKNVVARQAVAEAEFMIILAHEKGIAGTEGMVDEDGNITAIGRAHASRVAIERMMTNHVFSLFGISHTYDNKDVETVELRKP